jgi:hypothetical protein
MYEISPLNSAVKEKNAKSVTESLQRSRQLMALEIERTATIGQEFRKGATATQHYVFATWFYAVVGVMVLRCRYPGASTLGKAVDKHKEINMTAKQAEDLLKSMAVSTPVRPCTPI